MSDLVQPTLPPKGPDDSGFPDTLQPRTQAEPAAPQALTPILMPAPAMSGVERLVWTVLVLLTLCPAVGFLLAWWLG